MRRFIEWLTDRFGPDQPVAPKKPLWQTEEFKKAQRVRQAERLQQAKRAQAETAKPADVSYGTQVGSKIEDGGPGKNVLVRNKYLREDTGTHETLKIVDESLFETGEEDGIDPYNTGRFDRSKTWDPSRFRK